MIKIINKLNRSNNCRFLYNRNIYSIHFQICKKYVFIIQYKRFFKKIIFISLHDVIPFMGVINIYITINKTKKINKINRKKFFYLFCIIWVFI